MILSPKRRNILGTRQSFSRMQTAPASPFNQNWVQNGAKGAKGHEGTEICCVITTRECKKFKQV